jgi:DNA modification methylase
MTETYGGDGWTLTHGDCVEGVAALADSSIDLSIFSPPFISLYTYSATARDMGNCATAAEFFEHFGFLIRALLRVTKPGRHACCHVAQVAAMLERDGYIGLKDFRGQTIAAFEANGWIYHGEVCIDKDPQAQAIRTKAKGLLFVQMRKDSSWSRPALADYILVFRKPGENTAPIQPDITNEQWIEWARPIWYGIRESDTLHVAEARGEEDERHICPLQLGTIERCVRLWSNPGEVICSPFAGIGSEGYEAIRLGRRFLGFELKAQYVEVAVKNLEAAVAALKQGTLFAETPA